VTGDLPHKWLEGTECHAFHLSHKLVSRARSVWGGDESVSSGRGTTSASGRGGLSHLPSCSERRRRNGATLRVYSTNEVPQDDTEAVLLSHAPSLPLLRSALGFACTLHTHFLLTVRQIFVGALDDLRRSLALGSASGASAPPAISSSLAYPATPSTAIASYTAAHVAYSHAYPGTTDLAVIGAHDDPYYYVGQGGYPSGASAGTGAYLPLLGGTTGAPWLAGVRDTMEALAVHLVNWVAISGGGAGGGVGGAGGGGSGAGGAGGAGSAADKRRPNKVGRARRGEGYGENGTEEAKAG